MRVLILGDAQGNSGPSNVHKEFLKHWPKDDRIDFVSARDKIGFIREGIAKGLKADVVISPLVNFPCILAHDVLHILGKPIVCFNHGYVAFENEINRLGHSQWWVNRYKEALRGSDCIVANSPLQRDFVLNYQPELADRMENVMLGIDRFIQISSHCDEGLPIVVASGGSREIKGNDVVARACALLNENSPSCRLRVYGKVEPGFSSAEEWGVGEVCFMGQIPRCKFLKELNTSSLFIMNSRHDSFGLSLFDALREGCSVLVSRNCGALEVLDTEDCDVVEDCEDVREVADKTAYLLEHPNAKRLYATIDFDACCWDKQVSRLREICAQTVADKRRGGKR